jgi:hypothetical protein
VARDDDTFIRIVIFDNLFIRVTTPVKLSIRDNLVTPVEPLYEVDDYRIITAKPLLLRADRMI